jgi:ankyrin repeat protein
MQTTPSPAATQALATAIKHDYLTAAQAALAEGVDPNWRHTDGSTFLVHALKTKKPELAALILEKTTVDINADNNFHETAIMIAAQHGYTKICEQLILKGAKVNVANLSGHTPLMIAAECGHVDCCNLLLKANADINATNYEGMSVLARVVYWGKQEETAKLLIQAGADVQYRYTDKSTLLIKAVRQNMPQLYPLLIEKKVDIDAVDYEGYTALMRALEKEDSQACGFLINHNANLDITNDKGNSALLLAAKKPSFYYCKLLLEAGAEVNISDIDGDTPLSWAISHSDAETIGLLLKHGADTQANLNAAIKNIVLSHEFMDCARYLLAYGANKELSRDKSSCDIVLADLAEEAQKTFPAGSKPTRAICFGQDGKLTMPVVAACATGQFTALIATPLLRTKNTEDRTLFLDICKALPQHWKNHEAALYLHVLGSMQPPRQKGTGRQ